MATINMTSISSANGQQEMKHLFSRFDTNGDGKISLSELQLLMKTIGEELCCEEAKAFLQHAELDDDDLLDMEGFMRLVEMGTSEEEKSYDEEHVVMEAFKLYEMEGSGFITDRSLKRMLSRLGSSRPIEQCRSMIFSFDMNGDGVLCFDEFKAMMR
ncbi:putative calcium-binding protein CML19 [Phalaenopsis equestris]|uniref:putative calcium-binding protein CML19 n=1 Tax=Phalaenopsis equestris TaxID=78828 RepID=UPI0009E40581|nr:putative calcium-binding protein CML19 [Phalaenopsis equestris]